MHIVDSLDAGGLERVAWVATLRPQKDHHTLITAMVVVAREVPEAHLLLVGGAATPRTKQASGKLCGSSDEAATYPS